MEDDVVKPNLRERTHEVMRLELANAAFDLMAQEGYETLTSDDLARGIGVSRATFFRYFGSKDEVVVAAMLEPEEIFANSLPPPAGFSSQWQRLRAALEPAVTNAEASPERLRGRIRLIQSQPMLGARLRRARLPHIDRLAQAMVQHGAKPLAGQVIATAAVAVLDQCWAQWAREADASLRSILDEAFTHLEAASR